MPIKCQESKMTRPAEYATQNDKFYNYCLEEYQPLTTFAGKLRSSNLLFHFFDILNHGKPYDDIVKRIQNGIGLNKTVWGIKKLADQYAYEFYFYNSDWEKKNRPKHITDLLNIIQSIYPSHIIMNENFPYFMFSLDIFPGFYQQRVAGLHVYLGNFSYFFNETGMKMENHYAFYNPNTKAQQIALDVFQSAFIDFSKLEIQEILIPELSDCKRICRAHKASNDGIYFSGINIDQFIFFLKKFDYPLPIISFIEENKAQLDHLQFDVGFDYKMQDEKIKYLKSGYYGTF